MSQIGNDSGRSNANCLLVKIKEDSHAQGERKIDIEIINKITNPSIFFFGLFFYSDSYKVH